MMQYIALLRGVNVSGKNLIKMDTLCGLFREMGFENVMTYLQSGNVIFTARETSIKKLQQKISAKIKSDFGYDVPVILLTTEGLRKIIDLYPFAEKDKADHKFLYVTFLSAVPEIGNIKDIESKKQQGEEVIVSGNAAYIYCPKGYAKTRLTNSFFEAKLKVTATTRNWETTKKLIGLH